jgi:anthranilate synthase component 1
VADSDPRSEWLETQHKARALLRAAEIAQLDAAAGQATQN